VRLDATVPTTVEAWDASADTLLGRQVLPPTAGETTVTLAIEVTASAQQKVFAGWGPFSFTPNPPPAADRVEVRIWSGGNGRVDVYSVSLAPQPD